MALRGIQEYIAQDANSIAQVKDECNIVSIKGNIFLYPLEKSHSILLLFLLFKNSTFLVKVLKSPRILFL